MAVTTAAIMVEVFIADMLSLPRFIISRIQLIYLCLTHRQTALQTINHITATIITTEAGTLTTTETVEQMQGIF